MNITFNYFTTTIFLVLLIPLAFNVQKYSPLGIPVGKAVPVSSHCRYNLIFGVFKEKINKDWSKDCKVQQIFQD